MTDDPELLLSRHDCPHRGVDEKTFRCPQCHGILRRCCNSALGAEHRPPCETGKLAK